MPAPADPSQPTGKVAFLRWRGLDVPAILALPGLLFVPWLLLILLLIRDHLPGVICLTPGFWLLGPVIGLGIPQFSRSQTRIALRREAYLSGGVWGILTGATFLISGVVAFGPDPAVRSFALLSGAALIVFGAGSCALLAGWTSGRAIRNLGLDDTR